MKKLIFWQVIMTIITLAVFFITLQLIGNKEYAHTAGAGFLSVGAVCIVAVAFATAAASFPSASAVALAAIVAIVATAAAIFVTTSTAATAFVLIPILFAFLLADDLRLSKVKVMISSIWQFVVIFLLLQQAIKQ